MDEFELFLGQDRSGGSDVKESMMAGLSILLTKFQEIQERDNVELIVIVATNNPRGD